MRKNILKISVGILAVLTLLVTGCAEGGRISKTMEKVPPASVKMVPEGGKALVVFLRPPDHEYKAQASVFEINGNDPNVLGIIAAESKLACQLEPGEHLFMLTAIAHGAEFMTARVLPDKTYYVLIKEDPSRGGFSLEPVHKKDLDTPEFQKWNMRCRLVEKTPKSDEWVLHNMKSIQTKLAKGLPEWKSKPETKRPSLVDADGM
jgi:hypothetical protein